MNPREFCFWLQGFLALHRTVDEKMTAVILKRLQDALTKKPRQPYAWERQDDEKP